MTWLRTIALQLASLCLVAPLCAAELLPADREMADVIDHYVTAKLKAGGVTPATSADDAAVLRRTMLDIAGRVPTAVEAKAYLADSAADKRLQLVDRLLASPAFIRHQVNEFDILLGGGGRKGDMKDYLQLAIAENRPWDKIFRELMAADESEPSRKGASKFLKSRVEELDRVANETSVIFFGVNVNCAKCHDHPLVPTWTQQHYFGMASFFNRTFNNDGFLGEREYGLVSYETTEGEKRKAKLMFLTGKTLDEPEVEEPKDDAKKKEKELLEQAKKEKKAPPPPSFSRRAQLAEVALAPDQRHYFAKSIVNQLWNRFYGYGLVMPLDQMHPENAPSHPELLEWLARDLVEHNYDLKRLTRGLVLSQAYARSSRWDQGDRPDQTLFAVANIRPLTPAQYGAVLGIRASSPEQFPPTLVGDDLDQRLRGVEANGRGAVEKLEQPREGYQISVDEALLFTNSERVMREVIRDSKESLYFAAKSAPQRRDGITLAVWNTLGRAPDEEEIKLLEAYLDRRGDRVDDAWKQLVWALLTSTEARFNH